MVSNEVAIGVIIFLSIIYFILGLLAYSTIEHKKNTLSFGFTIWFVNYDKYNKFGKSLCPFGKILFISILATVALIFTT